jgi:hypothetical protein
VKAYSVQVIGEFGRMNYEWSNYDCINSYLMQQFTVSWHLFRLVWSQNYTAMMNE